jgi:hypothetical protein
MEKSTDRKEGIILLSYLMFISHRIHNKLLIVLYKELYYNKSYNTVNTKLFLQKIWDLLSYNNI